jgi:hypothetical protein
MQQDFGALSPNGDMADWLYCFLREPDSGFARAVLGCGLSRHGYGKPSELAPLIDRFANVSPIPFGEWPGDRSPASPTPEDAR